MNVKLRLLLAGLLAIALIVVAYRLRDYWTKAIKTENSGLRQTLKPETETHTAATGESVTIQPKAEVSAETFRDLMQPEISQWEKTLDQKLGRVEGLVKASITTSSTNRVPLRDTIIIRDTIPVQARAARWQGRFESGLVLIDGDSALVQTQVTNRIAVLETKDRWKPRHIFPWNWGTRKRRVNLLVFNPGTKVDTLSNLSVIR